MTIYSSKLLQTDPRAQATIQTIINEFPIHELYRFFNRFFVSGRTQFSGWLPGEKEEPGFLNACIFTFFYELEHIDEPLSVELIERIHASLIHGVLNTNYTEIDFKSHQTSFRAAGRHVQFGLIPGQNLSLAGLDELKRNHENPYRYKLVKNKLGNTEREYYALACYSDNAKSDVGLILSEYQESMTRLKYRDLSIEAFQNHAIKFISKMVTDLERLHPFSDGNCRTFCILTLNRELIKHGMPPTMMDDPNQFDGFSQSELIQKIKEGQARFLEILNKKKLLTPYRAGKLFLKSTGGHIPKNRFNEINLSKLSDFIISDEFEFISDGCPFVGDPETDVEIIIHRMIVQSAFNQLHQVMQNRTSARLLERLGTVKSIDDENTAYKQYFYSNGFSDFSSIIGFESSLKVIKAAINFGAAQAIQVLVTLLDDTKSTLANTFNNDLSEYSLVGHCLDIGRQNFAIKVMLGCDKDPTILDCLAHDLEVAYRKNNLQVIGKISKLISSFGLLDGSKGQSLSCFMLMSEVLVMLKASKARESESIWDFNSFLVSIKAQQDPVLEAEKLLHIIAQHCFEAKMPESEFIIWFKSIIDKSSRKVQATINSLMLEQSNLFSQTLK